MTSSGRLILIKGVDDEGGTTFYSRLFETPANYSHDEHTTESPVSRQRWRRIRR